MGAAVWTRARLGRMGRSCLYLFVHLVLAAPAQMQGSVGCIMQTGCTPCTPTHTPIHSTRCLWLDLIGHPLPHNLHQPCTLRTGAGCGQEGAAGQRQNGCTRHRSVCAADADAGAPSIVSAAALRCCCATLRCALMQQLLQPCPKRWHIDAHEQRCMLRSGRAGQQQSRRSF